MKIAYIVHCQWPGLMRQRPCLHNLSLGSKAKVELIAELLHRAGHEVEVLSQGEVDRYELRFYPALKESEPFHPKIPIYYASALPVRFLNGFWSGLRTVRLLRSRHEASPFDLVIIQTMKDAQIACARYASRSLGLPVILEYEDDSFLDTLGRKTKGLRAGYNRYRCRNSMKHFSGCLAASPYLLSQLPDMPKLLLRGVVSQAIIKSNHQPEESRKNWAVFSGTHEGMQGLEQMVQAWRILALPNWELHIAGQGPITPLLKKKAEGDATIFFHGFLNRHENARLLCTAKIGLNPQDITKTPGTSFAFKIIEYLAAGLHVITTPRGLVEPELEAGISYIADNHVETIEASLRNIIGNRRYQQTASQAAQALYGSEAVSKGLNRLLEQAAARAN